MSKATVSAAALALVASVGPAFAQDISTVNGYNVQLRVFNDFPLSTLNWGAAGAPVNAAPVPATVALAPLGVGLEFSEQFAQGTTGNFANKHQGLFSNNGGATPFGMNQHQSFTINFDITEHSAAGGARKEGGLKFYNDRGGGFIDEGEVMVASDNGEVAVFGSAMNIGAFSGHGFGPGCYTLGTTAHVTFNYFSPGTLSFYAAYQLIFTDAVTGVHDSGILDFDHTAATDPTNPANGFNSGSTLGFLDQNQRNPTIADFADIVYGNPQIVPAPAGVALLGLAGLAASRRRR
jgi:hypothetical protein